jgi:trans-2,3-dihydro-3-hydroxyanthranilate isomerase
VASQNGFVAIAARIDAAARLDRHAPLPRHYLGRAKGMPNYEFVTVDVFTDQRFGGNPLAVFPDARGLSDAAMQSLAAEFNLSETTFVLPPEDPANTARVRIFTPRTELPFAGHPNVGTAFVIANRLGEGVETMAFEERAGLVRVRVQRGAGHVVTGAMIEAPHSLQLGIEVPPETIAACIGLDAEEDIVQTAHTPLVASVGTGFVIAELASLDALGRAAPNLAAFQRAAKEFPELGADFALHIYVQVDGQAMRLRTRMFHPLGGITEDPATGSANAALAALLTALAPGDDVDLAFDITQGVEMGRPSRIYATAQKTGDGPVSASISGNCVPMLQGHVAL